MNENPTETQSNSEQEAKILEPSLFSRMKQKLLNLFKKKG